MRGPAFRLLINNISLSFATELHDSPASDLCRSERAEPQRVQPEQQSGGPRRPEITQKHTIAAITPPNPFHPHPPQTGLV